MVDVTLHVSSYHDAVIRLDERRQIARTLKAHDADGDFVAAQKALETLREKRAVAWLVGTLQRITDAESTPEVLPFVSLQDRWIRGGEVA